MHKYIRYVRTAEGHIERISYAVYSSPFDSFFPYLHEQSLMGWPESQVFWAKETGPSVGIAPLADVSQQTLGINWSLIALPKEATIGNLKEGSNKKPAEAGLRRRGD